MQRALVPFVPPAPQPPRDARPFLAGGIFILALLFALNVASAVVIPVLLAFFLKLVFQPAMRTLQRLQLPPVVGASVLVMLVVSCLVILGTALSAPAATWVDRLPTAFPRLHERLSMVSHSVAAAQKFLGQAETIAHPEGVKVMPVVIQGERLSDKVFLSTGALLTGLFTMLVVFFFLLVSGDTFLRKLVEILPRFKDKRQAVDISQQVEREISHYLVTITCVNLAVGMLGAAIMFLFGQQDAVLWGTIAFLLNFVPFVGPLVTVGIYCMVGLLSSPTLPLAILPAALFMLVHILEGSIVTPMLLAKRFALNPVIVILSIVFWYWMWGVAGAILAVPMITVAKLICDRIEKLAPVGHLLER